MDSLNASLIQRILDSLEKSAQENPNDDGKYEEIISKNIDIFYQVDQFYKLPVNEISKIVCGVDFSNVKNRASIIQTIIKKTETQHPNESFLLLKSLKAKKYSFSLEECLSILDSYEDYEIFDVICNSLKGKQQNQSQSQHQNDSQSESSSKDKDAFADIKNKPDDFEEDIFTAIQKGKITSVQYLIEVEGRDKNQSNKTGDSPLHWACYLGQDLIVKYLIEKQGVTPEINGNCGYKPLHYACQYRHLSIVQYLVSEAHANIETQSDDGDTPLICAARSGCIEIVKYLLEQGANKDAKNFNGRTAKDMVWRYQDIRALLE